MNDVMLVPAITMSTSSYGALGARIVVVPAWTQKLRPQHVIDAANTV